MKKPAFFLPVIFIMILGCSAMIATTVSGICSSFYKNNPGKNIEVKTSPSAKDANENIKLASIKL